MPTLRLTLSHGALLRQQHTALRAGANYRRASVDSIAAQEQQVLTLSGGALGTDAQTFAHTRFLSAKSGQLL